MSHKITHRIYGEGPPLLLLHGYGGSVHHWNPLIELLKNDYQLFVPNLSHLYLSRDQIYFSVQAMALLKWIESLEIQKPIHIMGTSYGATLGLAISSYDPQLVKSLTLINPLVTDPVSKFTLPELRYFFVSNLKKEDLEYQLSMPIGRSFLSRASALFRNEKVSERIELLGRKKEFFVHFVHNFSWILNNENWLLWEEKLKTQNTAKLLIHDLSDKLFTEQVYKTFSQKLKNCQVHQTIDGGHLSLLSIPSELSLFILDFLAIQEGQQKKSRLSKAG